MKISLITACYNSGRTLRNTLESVLRQTYRDIEYIVIDGASQDDTLSIVREYEPRFDGRMRWVSEPDKGIYDAMNKGFALATGDVIGILNSDDFFTSDDVLARVAAAMEDKDVDAVYGDVHYVNDSNLSESVRYYSSKHFRRWQMRLGFMPAHPSFYCRRRVYEEYGTFNASYRVAADFELLLRLIYLHGIRTRYVPLDFVTMRTGGASTSGFKSYKKGLQEHLRAYRENGVRSNIFLDGLRFPCKLATVVAYRLRGLLQRCIKKKEPPVEATPGAEAPTESPV